MDRLRVNDVFTNWKIGGGIFDALQSFNVPWAGDDIASLLDLEYHGNVSGEKYISPLISKLITSDTILDSERDEIAHIIVTICGINWNKQYTTMELVYNPIENYSMSEKMVNDKTVTEYGKTHTRTDDLTHNKTGTDTQTPNTTETRTDNFTHGKTGADTQTPNTTETRTNNLTHGKTGTDTQTPNTTETQIPDLKNTSENIIHGFNSSVGVPTGEQSQKSTGTQTIARTGTDKTEYNTQETDTGTQETTRTGTDKTEYNTQETDTGTQETTRTGTDKTEYNTQETDTGTQTDIDGGTDMNTRNYELTRAGNIGVTTSQQMIQSERDLWKWNFFRDIVFPDLDRILTLQIY